MKKIYQFLLCIIIHALLIMPVFAQVGINTDGTAPNPSAILDAKSTSKGFLPPRMTTTQMNAISSPPAGLMVYNTTLNSICWFNGTSWDIGINRDGASCGTVNYGGQTYTSVIIGMQCWMKENLNIGVAILGSEEQTNNAIIEKYCYDNNSTNCTTYGGLYQWNEMMQYVTTPGTQGICPTGWHLPTDAEWTRLTTYLGGEPVAGGKMKETGTTHWLSPNTGATNSSGFTALPGGVRGSTNFANLTYYAFFWSSSQVDATYAWYRRLNYDYEGVYRLLNGDKTYGYSTRCVQD
ncbi:MAG: FISUMP domain-containing protein [bacterium]